MHNAPFLQNLKGNTMTGTLEHANITVADVQKTADFLCDLFGWHIRWKGAGSDGGPWIHVGSKTSYLAIHTPTKPVAGGAEGYDVIGRMNHVGITVANLEPVLAKVVNAGYEPYNFGEYEPGRRFYFKDSDGIEFEVVCYD